MAKIICAFPGTGRVKLFHHLRQQKAVGRVGIHMQVPECTEAVMRWWGPDDVIILPATAKLVQELVDRKIEHDLVAPDLLSDPQSYTVHMAMEGMNLSAIHSVMDTWATDIAAFLPISMNPYTRYIVLGQHQTLIDTHGSIRNGQQSS